MGAYTRFAAGAAAFGLSLAAWAAPVYRITDLGVLPSHEHSRATDLNEGGQVVGDSQRYAGAGGPGERRAFVWSAAAGMIDLGLPDGASTMNATGLNDTGEVVGHYEDPASRLSRAYRWTAQGGLRLADPADGAVSLLYDINAAGQISGASRVVDGRVSHAFLWSEEAGLRDLGTLPGERASFAAA
ncbi:MAG TPA: hypothetical protein VLA16_09830 [Ideonella sp.]|nr:hypothetical protein [Ideonella sp.]